MADSIIQLFSDLCESHIKDNRRAFLCQPKSTRTSVKLRLKTAAYDALFGYLLGPLRSQVPVIENDEEILKILGYVYHLRLSRRFDDADRLEKLLGELVDIGANSENREKYDGISSVLKLLVLLAGTGPKEDEPLVGYKEKSLPIQDNDQDDMLVLPSGPLWYGDTKIIRPDDSFYMHYSRDLFEVEPLKQDSKSLKLFEATPGFDLDGIGLFNVTGYLNDTHEKFTKGSLFGALVQGRFTSLELKLDLPDLPDETDMKLLECRIPKVPSEISQISEDEGFLETQLTESSSTVYTEADSAIEVDIWEEALSYIPSRHYTWESRGQVPGPTEKPYITEAGNKGLDEWYRLKQREINVMCPHVVSPELIEISYEELIQDTINLLIAIPSTTYLLSKEHGMFKIKEGIFVSGLTPEMLQHVVQDFLECGAHYYRLEQFSLPPEIDSFYSAGLIFQAFKGVVRKVLQHHRATILSIPPETTLLRLKVICHKIFSQIRFLSAICKCTDEDTDLFPTGIQLLSYIYRETLESASTDHYPMMLSLLQATCAPYIMFVQDWVFHGIHRDIYGEFLIEVHQDYLEFRDKNYWSKGFTLTSAETTDCVPLFLTDLAEDIFVCGKSLNLLKACCPQHFLCNVNDYDIPHVSVTYSELELSSLNKNCQIYISKMQQIARQIVVNRKQMQERAKAAKVDLLQRAKQIAMQQIEKLQEKILQNKKAEDEKKRKEFKFLKEQMETDKERRASQKETEKKEDKEYIAKITRQEEAMDEKELELERRAREEMIEYYSKLTEEATYREQKALWRVRRAQLREARLQFLEENENLWKDEMEKFLEISKEKEDLPSWAQRSGENKDPVIVTEEAGLPNWAQKRLTSTGPATVITDDDSKVLNIQMPNWAKKVLLSSDGSTETVVVDGEKDGEDDDVFNDVTKQILNSKSSDVDLGEPDQNLVPAGRSSSDLIKRPPTPNIKTGLKLSDKMSATAQSEALPWRPGIQVKGETFKESEAVQDDKPQIKILNEKHVSMETTEDSCSKPIIKSVGNIHVSKQTESSDIVVKPHIKSSGDMHATKQSTEEKEVNFPKMKRLGEMDSLKESEPQEWKVKKASVYGHVSQLSNMEFTIAAPRLKRPEKLFALEESDLRDFSIRPKIRFNKQRHANIMSDSALPQKPHIKMSDNRSSTLESDYVDIDEIRRQKFRKINLYGHASDSTVQKLLYGGEMDEVYDPKKSGEDISVAGQTKKDDFVQFWLDEEDNVEPYQDDFKVLDEKPMTDLLATRMYTPYGGLGDYGISLNSDVELYRYIPLPALLKHSITTPLMAQISLVNDCVINYMTTEMQIDQHFLALHRYLFMADGDFAQILSDILLEKLASNPKIQELLNPVFLNGALTKSLQLSMHTDDQYADNLSFVVRYIPNVLQQNVHDTLDCLELRYKVKWPVNIIITDKCITKYSKVFSFMLQLKRVVWVLKDVWHKLKRDALVHKVGSSSQFRQLQLYRQEMQHFVKVMQGYITNQIIHVAWQELQEALTNDVKNLDDLHRVHTEYLDRAIFRCLLNKKAAPLMKIIQDIFCLILKFRTQLINATWLQKNDTEDMTNSAFSSLCSSYKAFREYSYFLFKVVNKLAIRGYQPHLQELLLRLNFNDYYKEK